MIKNFPYRNLRHYLDEHGLLNAKDDVLSKAKKEYFKLYQRAYRLAMKKHQLNILLSKEDFMHLLEKAKKYDLKKPTQYLLHLIQNDRDKLHERPNLLIDIEIGILKTLDDLTSKMKHDTRIIHTVRQLEELLLILAS